MRTPTIKKDLQGFFSADGAHFSTALAKRIALLFAFLSFLGFMDAFYLTVEHYRGQPVNCIVLNGCDTVLTSGYAEIFGIPIALIGVIYYLFIFSSILFFLFGHSEKLFKTALAVSSFGFGASLWFITLQLFIIKSICFYCMISAFSSIMMFLAALFLFSKIRKHINHNSHSN